MAKVTRKITRRERRDRQKITQEQLDAMSDEERANSFLTELKETLEDEFLFEKKTDDTPLKIAKKARQVAKKFFPEDTPKFKAVENDKNPFSYDLVWDGEWLERHPIFAQEES